MAFTVEQLTPEHLDEWIVLRCLLWPEGSEHDRRAEAEALLQRLGRFVVFLARSDEPATIGFAEATLRHDGVHGCATFPVAFLEGIYVQPTWRRRGVARQLCRAIEAWAGATGCSEFASDTELDNTASQHMHAALGFQETERVVYYRKLVGASQRRGIAAGRTTQDDQANDNGGSTMTSRVPMVSLERARELGEAMGMPARRTQSEAFRVVANNPGVARVAFGQLMQLLENNKFDTRLRELMIMRIGWVTGSAYEWTQHWRVATTAGIPPEDILAVRDWRNSDRLTAADEAILAATDECLAGRSISDAAWAEVAKHVTDPGQQVEFIIAMGNWMSFSMLFRNLRIPLAEGLMVWPPDGLASPAADK